MHYFTADSHFISPHYSIQSRNCYSYNVDNIHIINTMINIDIMNTINTINITL